MTHMKWYVQIDTSWAITEMITLRLKEFSGIAIATVLRKLTCSKTCRPKLDLACNKKINMAIYSTF